MTTTTTTTTTTATPAHRLTRVSAVTVLGDSVPYGTACGCAPYPQLTADGVARATGHPVADFNDAEPGFRSTDVIQQLQSDAGTIADVEKADTVMIEIGANDVAFSATCGTNASCYESKLPQVAANITAITSRVRQLTAGRLVTLVLIDYWRVWLAGRYAQARGPAYVAADGALTRAFSRAIESIAQETGSVYIDLRTAFGGPNDDDDETSLLAHDGDHPDIEGHQRIAAVILSALSSP